MPLSRVLKKKQKTHKTYLPWGSCFGWNCYRAMWWPPLWLLIWTVFAQVKQEIKSKLVQHYRRRNKRQKNIPCKVTQVRHCNMLLNTGPGFLQHRKINYRKQELGKEQHGSTRKNLKFLWQCYTRYEGCSQGRRCHGESSQVGFYSNSSI